MLEPRIIPCLLLKGKGLVKGAQFKNHRYVGDPINAVQIFNSKEVDEIIFLDIEATKNGRIPDPEFIQKIADQCLVPFAVGGGIRSLEDARKILRSGAEKVCLNSAAWESPQLITEIAEEFGSQSIVVSLDYKKNLWGKKEAYIKCGTQKIKGSLEELAQLAEKQGAGELLLNSIDRDGSREGYEIDLIRDVSKNLKIPVIAQGGAGSEDDLKEVLQHTDAAAAGSLFVFHGRRQGVLISYPAKEQLRVIKGVI